MRETIDSIDKARKLLESISLERELPDWFIFDKIADELIKMNKEDRRKPYSKKSFQDYFNKNGK